MWSLGCFSPRSYPGEVLIASGAFALIAFNELNKETWGNRGALRKTSDRWAGVAGAAKRGVQLY